MKLTISIDEDLVKLLDEEADSCFLSRSSLISLACSQYLSQKRAIGALSDLSVALNKIADKGGIDEDSKKQLDDFKKLSELLGGGEVGKR